MLSRPVNDPIRFRVRLKLVEPRPPPPGVRRARKTFGHVEHYIEISDSDDGDGDPSNTKHSRTTSVSGGENSGDESILNNMGSLTINRKVVDANNNTEAAQMVATAISALPHTRSEEMLMFTHRIPFLRRNVRSATEWLALQRQTPVPRTVLQNSAEEAPVLRLQFDIKALRVVGYRQVGWRCPLCPVFRDYPFITRNGLEYHLSEVHPQIVTQFESVSVPLDSVLRSELIHTRVIKSRFYT